jgi:hypothetical protein
MEISQTRTLFLAVIVFLTLNMPRIVLFAMEIHRLKNYSWCKVCAQLFPSYVVSVTPTVYIDY